MQIQVLLQFPGSDILIDLCNTNQALVREPHTVNIIDKNLDFIGLCGCIIPDNV